MIRSKPFQLEAGLSRAIWDLFSQEGPQDLAFTALLEQLPSDNPSVKRFASRLGDGVLAWIPPASPGPDLCFLSEDRDNSEILAVVEVKVNASANDLYLKTGAGLAPLPGAEADVINHAYFKDGYDPKGGMRQTDLYRSRAWWKPKNQVWMADPAEVLWMVFDANGRSTFDAVGGVLSEAWLPVDLRAFAVKLRELRAVTELSQKHHDAIAVVLWHINIGAPLDPLLPVQEDQQPVHTALG